MAGSLLDRALGILEFLASKARGMPLQAIADQLDIPKSAAHRLLAELARHRYVRQDEETGRYLLTTKLVSLGFQYLAGSGVVDVAQPILDRLAQQTGELVRLGVIDGDRLIWVAKAQGAGSGLRYDPDMGAEATLSSTASGQAWLACLDDNTAIELIMRQGFGPFDECGPNAPRTIEAVLERLRQARECGYSWAVDSSAIGMAAISAAVRHPVKGQPIGVISVAGPSARLDEARLQVFAPALLNAAAELSAASLGSAYLAEAGHYAWRSSAERAR